VIGESQGVLVLPPPDGEGGWTVVEIDRGLAVEAQREFATAGRALQAAYDVLTLMSEGRMPGMYEHTQESVRDFVRALEARGYDRESAVKLLLDMVDRRASAPPKADPRPAGHDS
jgi:hypothetical protein